MPDVGRKQVLTPVSARSPEPVLWPRCSPVSSNAISPLDLKRMGGHEGFRISGYETKPCSFCLVTMLLCPDSFVSVFFLKKSV